MENKNLAPHEPVVREGAPTPSNATAEPAAAFTRGPLAYGHTGMDDPNSGPPWWEVYTPHAGATAYVWREADARLYSFAPDLVEALKELWLRTTVGTDAERVAALTVAGDLLVRLGALEATGADQ